MSSRRILLYLFIILVLLTLTRPSVAWAEAKRIWSQRNWMLGVVASLFIIYFAYGLYQMWVTGLWWWR